MFGAVVVPPRREVTAQNYIMADLPADTTKRVTIHLPNHLAPIAVSLPQNATIADLKRAIFNECPGRPKPEGQRIISSGKELADTDTLVSGINPGVTWDTDAVL